MAKVCQKCGKSPATGHNVSHSIRRTKRRFMPNLVKKRIDGQKITVCTRCLRSSSKV